MQGTARADCTLYYWNHYDKIVVSDVDGTITRYYTHTHTHTHALSLDLSFPLSFSPPPPPPPPQIPLDLMLLVKYFPFLVVTGHRTGWYVDITS